MRVKPSNKTRLFSIEYARKFLIHGFGSLNALCILKYLPCKTVLVDKIYHHKFV